MFLLISRSLAKVTYMEFNIILFLYFPMDFIFLLEISSDTALVQTTKYKYRFY